jgi:hypothetical protein
VCIVPNCCTNKNQNELFSTHGAVIIGSKKIRSADWLVCTFCVFLPSVGQIFGKREALAWHLFILFRGFVLSLYLSLCALAKQMMRLWHPIRRLKRNDRIKGFYIRQHLWMCLLIEVPWVATHKKTTRRSCGRSDKFVTHNSYQRSQCV